MLMEADGFCPSCYCEWVRYRLGYNGALSLDHPLTQALSSFPEGFGSQSDAAVMTALLALFFPKKRALSDSSVAGVVGALLRYGVHIPFGVDADVFTLEEEETYLTSLGHVLWGLLLRFEIADCLPRKAEQSLHIREVIAADHIRKWAAGIAAPRPYSIQVDDLTHSWRDGRALLALLDHATKGHAKPKITENPLLNLEAALSGLESYGIPKLVRCDLVVAGPRDSSLKQSILAYLAVSYRIIQSKSTIQPLSSLGHPIPRSLSRPQ